MELTKEIIREFIDYNPDTGEIFWKFRDRRWFKNNRAYNSWNSQHAGKRAFNIHSHEYLYGTIFKKRYLTHRIVWFYMTGEWPIEVDHNNGKKIDNRWVNLNNVTKSGNMKNTKTPITNTSGIVGVYWYPRYNKWLAKISYKKNPINLGYFDKFEDAVKARKQAEIDHGFNSNHGRKCNGHV